MAAVVKDLVQLNTDIQEQKERIDTVDFKMVTFSLAGKEYGVDIMNVKEIAKADKFTYVPNAASFVQGVYNLRGDIIPIIDLRQFFHLPNEKRKDGLENMLILRIEDRVYGTIVDKIDKVVGINTESIQPPHPIFGDINIKFISGVVEKNETLYIILDVLRIFSISEDDKQKPRGAVEAAGTGAYYAPPDAAGATTAPIENRQAVSDNALGFIRESLPALKQFYPSELNDEWIRRRFKEWSSTHSGDELQLKTVEEAEEFLAGFYSPDSGQFWSDEYASFVKSILPPMASNTIQVWNIACGKGYESYSIACILKSKYPNSVVKVWANDADIMAISQAPNLVFDFEDVPEYCRSFTVKGRTGYTFNQVIKDTIVFEYHDVMRNNPLPDLDLIVARDAVSFFQQEEQVKLAEYFKEKLKSKGIVILGRNEFMPGVDWDSIGKDPVSMFVCTSR
jgi:purine-binding chemotaxis protein CheW